MRKDGSQVAAIPYTDSKCALGYLALKLLPAKNSVAAALKTAYFDDRKITKEQIEVYAAAQKTPEGRRALIKTAKQIIPKNIDKLISDYKNITVPTLILWGKQDKIIPLRIGQALQRAIPNSQLVIIDKCGHVPQEEKPDETVPVITRFLDDVLFEKPTEN